MLHSHCHKFHKCRTFVASVASVTFSFRKCHIAKDTMKTLDTTPKNMLEEEFPSSDSRNKCFSMGIAHLDNFWEDQRSHAHTQGAP
jgi:hypothetical protein